MLTSKRRPLQERRGHVRPSSLAVYVLPQLLVTPGKTVKIYLSHLEVPLAFSSRMSAFYRGYWGRGTPCSQCEVHQPSHCSDDGENVPGRSDCVPRCSVYLAVYCLWTQAEDRRLVPWSNCPSQCCSHCIQPGHCALHTTDTDRQIRTIATTVSIRTQTGYLTPRCEGRAPLYQLCKTPFSP